MAIIKFIVGNLKKRKSYSIVIFALVFLTGVILSVTLSTVENAGKAYDIAFNRIQGPHLRYSFEKSDYKSTYGEWFEKQSNVKAVKLCIYASINGAVLQHGKKEIAGSSDIYLSEYKPKNNMRLIDNVYPHNKKLTSKSIYLPYIFKTEKDVSVGDYVDYVFGASKLHFKVAGFIEDPISGGKFMGTKCLYISRKDYDSFLRTGKDGAYEVIQMGVRVKNFNIKTSDELNERFLDKFVPDVNFVSDYNGVKNSHLELPKIALVIMITFTIILCIITLTIIRYTILATIEADYVNIGIVKALGFTPTMVQLSIAGQYALIAFFASILSLLAGLLVTPFMGALILQSSGLYFTNILPVAELLIPVLLVTFVSLFSYVTSRKTKSISPVRAISNGAAPIYFSSRININLDRISFIPFNGRMALKQVLTKSKRYILLILISAIFAYTLSFSMGLTRYFNSDEALSIAGTDLSDIELDANLHKDAETVLSAIKKDYNVKWTVYMKREQLEAEGQKTTIEIENDFYASGGLFTLEGRFPKHDNEVAVSTLLKDRYGKGVGDFITIKDTKGKGHKYIISGIFQTTSQNGYLLRLVESGIKKLVPDFELNEAYITLKDSHNLNRTIEQMKKRYTGYEEISNQKKETMDQVNTIRLVFSSISRFVFLLTVIMVSLVTLLVMKITIYAETKELGIQKALGFSSSIIRLQLALRFIFVTLGGGLFGAIIESLVGSKIFGIAIAKAGLSNFNIPFRLSNFAIPILLIMALALFSSYISSSNTKRISTYALINE